MPTMIIEAVCGGNVCHFRRVEQQSSQEMAQQCADYHRDFAQLDHYPSNAELVERGAQYAQWLAKRRATHVG